MAATSASRRSTSASAGERNLALRIFHVARVEPTERPAMQTKNEDD